MQHGQKGRPWPGLRLEFSGVPLRKNVNDLVASVEGCPQVFRILEFTVWELGLRVSAAGYALAEGLTSDLGAQGRA